MEISPEGAIRRFYTYGVTRCTVHTTLDTFFILEDLVGSTVAVMNSDGTVRTFIDNDPFGENIRFFGNSDPVSASEVPAQIFSGMEYDPDAQLHYIRARWYDPVLGRFLSRDPQNPDPSFPDTYNPYNYVNNNPIGASDPSGEFVVQAAFTAAGAAVGVLTTYAGDVAGNIAAGKAGADIFIPTSSASTYIGSAVAGGLSGLAASVPGGALVGSAVRVAGNFIVKNPYASSIATNVIGEGVKQTIDGDFSATGFRDAVAGGALGAKFGGKLEQVITTSSENLGVKLGFKSAVDFLGGYSSGKVVSDLSSGKSPLGGPDVGGVFLSKTAQLMLSLKEIHGASFDPATGQIVLVGTNDTIDLPEMKISDISVAMDSVLNYEDPGVSIDPPVVNSAMSVRYLGKTKNTDFGAVMFEADRILKNLMSGTEIVNFC